jgi:hypothetical protein
MSQEDYPVEFVLESLESVMAPQKQPKVILFDIGGVCVGDDIPPFSPDNQVPASHILIFDLTTLYMYDWGSLVH